MNELTIIERDRLGLLNDVTAALERSHVGIESVFLKAGRAKRAVVRVVLDSRNAEQAVAALCDAGFNVCGRC